MTRHSALRTAVFVLVISFFITSLGAQQSTQPEPQSIAKRPITFDDMMAMKRLGESALSPDAKWLAYSATTVELATNARTSHYSLQSIEAPTRPPFSIDATVPGDSGLQFAADGKSILFLSSRSGSSQIYSATFDPETGKTTNPTRLTNIATEADNAQWSPDQKNIVFTSSVYPDCPAITTADQKSGDHCNSDRDLAAATSKVKAQIFDHLLYRHWNHYSGPKRSHLFELTLATGAVRDLTPNDTHDTPPFSLGGGGGFAISPDSKELAFTEDIADQPALSTNADIFTLDLTDPSAKPVKISTSLGGDFNPAYSPDGRFLAWRSQVRPGYESDRFRLILYDRAAKSSRELLTNFDLWVDEFVWEAGWLDKSQHILFVAGEKGRNVLYQIDAQGKKLRRIGRVAGEWGDIHYATWQGPDYPYQILHGYDVVIGSMMRVDMPAEIVAVDLVKANDDANIVIYKNADDPNDKGHHVAPYQPIQLTHLNNELLAKLDLAPLESFWFTASDKVKVQGFLIKPPAFDPNKKYPVKFLIHGGPQGAWGDAWSYRWNAELFAANGYLVVMINPRGSTGYGQKFVDGVNGDWGGRPYQDLMEGLDYAEQRFAFLDKSREAALGASYGGYMANWVLGHTDRFKCIVTHDGMFNPESAFGSTEEMWFNTWEFKGRPWDYAGKPDSENPFRKWSPAAAVANFKTPTLVVHGQLDYRLDVSEGFALFTALQLQKVPSKMLYFPDEGHWVLKPQNSQLWYKTVNDWVDQWTK